VWSTDLTPAGENSDDASGGGLSVAGGTVFASTGFGELRALNIRDGAELWRQRLGAAVTGAPTVDGKLVYVSTRAGQGWAIDTESGRVEWIVRGVPSQSGIEGGSAPAVGSSLAIFPLSSGEVLGVFKKGGLMRWQSSAVGARHGLAYADVTDITGDPVIGNGTIYVGNSAGRTVALDPSTGERRWTAGEGALGSLVLAGNSLFTISDRFQLVRIDTRNGQRIWAIDLPGARQDSEWRGVQYHAQSGPVLAGGLLWVGSASGHLNGFDPVNGALRHSIELPAGAATRPIVVNNTLYIVNTAGQLLAFR
ncbi:MAG: PQQ-like beta-propeller repeat protein, partial [Paracoccaceae bacterium]|nr:PQQ-like beta-propeller repeat protein [Paracoccaceae bacterium]